VDGNGEPAAAHDAPLIPAAPASGAKAPQTLALVARLSTTINRGMASE
jgi:hypothetical protein